MVLSILPFIQTVLEVNRSRKASIMDFCNAYLRCEQFSIMTYFSKKQGQCIQESIDEISTSIEHLAQWTDPFKLELEVMTEEIFETRPSETLYVIPLLEYSLYKQSALQKFSSEEFVNYLTDILYRYSDFYPTRRYHIIVCMFLYFLNLL